MKKVIAILVFVFATGVVFGAATDCAAEGDKYYKKRNDSKDRAAAIKTIDKAIENYRKAVDKKPSYSLYYKLALATEFKFHYLLEGENTHQLKWDAYKSLVDEMEKYCEENGKCADSAQMQYALAIVWGRFGELMNPMEAASSGLAGKMKGYAERIIEIDPSFKDYAAYASLGRLHFKAPNIIFILTWPDKKKSKEYLEVYFEKNPDSLLAKHFLADTLWDVDEKERSKKLFLEVINSKPGKEYFNDLRVINDCKEAAKEKGIIEEEKE